MFSCKLFVTNVLVLAAVLVATPSNGLPIYARGREICKDGKPGPCICNQSYSVKENVPYNSCPNFTIVFVNDSETDGSLTLVSNLKVSDSLNS